MHTATPCVTEMAMHSSLSGQILSQEGANYLHTGGWKSRSSVLGGSLNLQPGWLSTKLAWPETQQRARGSKRAGFIQLAPP